MFQLDRMGFESFIEEYKNLGIKIPFKYVEKGLLIDIEEELENFTEIIKDYIIVADLTEKTKKRYLRDINQNESNYDMLFNVIKSFV